MFGLVELCEVINSEHKIAVKVIDSLNYFNVRNLI